MTKCGHVSQMPQNAAFTGHLTVFSEKSGILHRRKWFSNRCPQNVYRSYYTALRCSLVPIRQSQLRSLDFIINRLFMKLFKTNDIRLVHLCEDLFHFHLPSKLLQQRSKKFMDKIKLICTSSSRMVSYLCFFLSLVKFIFLYFFLFWLRGEAWRPSVADWSDGVSAS